MKKVIITASLVLSAILSTLPAHAFFNKTQQAPPQAVTNIDLNKYKGTWYEIARKPTIFQIFCYKNVTATYEIVDTNNIKVINNCKGYFNRNINATGRAKVAESTGQLRVDFIPKALEWLQFDKSSNYWVIAIDDDYNHVMVGSPTRKYLWILSRNKTMPTKLYHKYLRYAYTQGYDISNIKKTRQY